MKRNRINIGSLLSSVLMDLTLIALGFGIYYIFTIRPLGFVGLNDIFVRLMGGNKTLAVYILSGLPFLIGVLSLARTIFRTGKKLRASNVPQNPAA